MLELKINDIVLRYLRWEKVHGKKGNWKTSGVCVSTYSKTSNNEQKKNTERLTFENGSVHFVKNIIYGFPTWMVMRGKEGRRKKAALNVKIEKLLFLFSWQNIFIAFSSATILLPFRWNMMFKCLLYFSLLLQPLIKTFRSLFLIFCVALTLTSSWNVIVCQVIVWMNVNGKLEGFNL